MVGRPFEIPKGFRRKAQGCEERATLGELAQKASQPQRGCDCRKSISAPYSLYLSTPSILLRRLRLLVRLFLHSADCVGSAFFSHQLVLGPKLS